MSALVATTADAVVVSAGAAIGDIEYRDYTDETMLREIQVLVATDLSERNSTGTPVLSTVNKPR
jgi:hypothetical protein